MNNNLREKLAIGSVVVAVVGHLVGEPVISLIGAFMIFVALTVPPEQKNDSTDSDN